MSVPRRAVVALAAVLFAAPGAALAAPAPAPAPGAPQAAARATERRLYSDQVEASSFLWNDWNKFQENYHPSYAVDDDPKTAWTEGAATSGAGEWLRIRVTELAGTRKVRLKIRNGYQKSAALFAANARGKDVTVVLLPSGVEKKVALADAQGWQEVAIDQPDGPLEAIELRFGAVAEGGKYTDLCVSDVQVFATSTTRENPSFERDKRDRLRAWKAERVKAAKLFARGGGKDVPLSPAYTIEKTESPAIEVWERCEGDWRCHTREALALARRDKPFVAAYGALLPLAERAAAAPLAGFLPAKLAPRDRRPFPAVDGLYVPGLYFGVESAYGYEGFELPIAGGLASLRGETLRPLEIKSAVTPELALAARAPGCTTERGATYAWLLRGKLGGEQDGRDVLRALVVVQCGKVEVRDGTADAAQFQLLVYGEDGSLGLVAGPGYVNGYRFATDNGRLILDGGRRILSHGSRDTLVRGRAGK